MTEGLKLWPHQQAAVQAAEKAIKTGRRSGLIAAPTGAGKSIIFADLARRLGGPTLVMVHRDELVRQTQDTFAQVWPGATIGVCKAERDEWSQTADGRTPDVVIASVPSLHNGRLTRIPANRFDLIVCDEAHHAAAKTWTAVLEHFTGATFRLGCTATPDRADGQGIAEHFGTQPLYVYPLRQAIEDEYLSRLSQYAVSTTTDLDDVAYRAGDLAVNELSRSVNTPARNKVVVEAYQELAPDRRALVFAVDVAHVEALHAAFVDAGIATDYVTGQTDLELRRESLRRFARGDTRIMVNCAVLTEGFDDRGVDAVLMARPTCSRPLYTQCIGRGLRRAEGKQDCLILDFVDNSRRHKLITVMDLMGAPTLKNAKGQDVIRAVDADRAEAEKQHLIESVAPLEWTVSRVCPWPELPTLNGYIAVAEWQGHRATEKQVRFLRRLGVSSERALTKGEASFLIDRAMQLNVAHPAPPTSAQTWFLRQHGAWCNGMTFEEASQAIGKIKAQERKELAMVT